MIYFIQAINGRGPVKIGHTSRPVGIRLQQIQVGSPVRLAVRLVMDGDRKAEVELHKRFWASRLAGEWFRYAGPVRAFIRAAEEAESGRRFLAELDAAIAAMDDQRKP